MKRNTRARRVRRVDVDPPKEYPSITSASAHTGVNPTSLNRYLNTGIFFGGIWESPDPPLVDDVMKVDGVIYPSGRAAAIACGCSSSCLAKFKKKGLTKFTIKGHAIEVVTE